MSKQQLRKMEDQLKTRNRGMIQQVGLHELPRDLLLGALILLARKLREPRTRAFALKLGKQAMAKRAASKNRSKEPKDVFIVFLDPPSETLRTQLEELIHGPWSGEGQPTTATRWTPSLPPDAPNTSCAPAMSRLVPERDPDQSGPAAAMPWRNLGARRADGIVC